MASNLTASIKARAEAQRILAQESSIDDYYVKKPIGSFVGQWVGFDDSGVGLVSYKGRVYQVKVLTNSYAKLNQKVSLTLTKEGNFAAW